MTRERLQRLRAWIEQAAGKEVAFVYSDGILRLPDEREALLEAVRGLDTDYEPTGRNGNHRDTEGNGDWTPEDCPFCRARAALAKAESP